VQEVAHRAVPARLRPWLALLAVALVCAGIQVAGDPAARALRYERNALLDGQLWRALTGHVVHLSWAHLGLNLAAAAVIAAAFGRDLRWIAILLTALGVTAGLFLGSIRVTWYAGLSGVLYGLAAYGALDRSRGRRAWLVLAALVAAKAVADEFRTDPRGFDGSPVIVDAHLYGVISGALAFAILYRPRRARL
jgi:rhomboid family GlyGly-CTERM serine protease